MFALGISFLLSSTPGCFMIPSADSPLGKLASPGVERAEGVANTATTANAAKVDVATQPRKPLVVMLPGMGDRMGDFAEAGFIDPGVARDFDVIAVDAHFGYYRERNLIPRLHEDIIEPARAAGYRQIWLLGISMGGFGSLLYASQYPDEIAGVILLSPFLGNPALIKEIEEAGGLRSWENNATDLDEEIDQVQLDLWNWLKRETASENGTPVILGYGRGERMARAYGPLLQVLEPCRVFVRKGGHKWSTWKPLWRQIAEESTFSSETNQPVRACPEAVSISGRDATHDAFGASGAH